MLLNYLTILTLMLFSLSALAAETTWWNNDWSYRISIVLENKLGIKRQNEPVVITGKMLSGAGKIKGTSFASWRLIDSNGEEVAFQIDEKNNQGLYQHPGNGVLDLHDEMVFQINLKPNESKIYFLYFKQDNENGKITPNKYAPVFEVSEVNSEKQPYQLIVKKQKKCFGIQGGGNNIDKIFRGEGKGAITKLQISGVNLLAISQMPNSYLFWSAFRKLSWQDPVVISNGPVRTIILVKTASSSEKFNHYYPYIKGEIKGEIYRYFIIYNNLPYFLLNEKIPVVSQLQVTYYLPLLPSGIPRDWLNEKIYFPDDKGGISVADYKTPSPALTMSQLNKNKTVRGWFAFHNSQKNIGLAVFYPKNVIGLNVNLYPIAKKYKTFADIMASSNWVIANIAADVRLKLEINGNIEHSFGFYGLNGESPEQIKKTFTYLWEAPVADNIVIKNVEEQK